MVTTMSEEALPSKEDEAESEEHHSTASSTRSVPRTCGEAKPVFKCGFCNLLQQIFCWKENDPPHEVLEAMIKITIMDWFKFTMSSASEFQSMAWPSHFGSFPLSPFNKSSLIHLHQMFVDRFANPDDIGHWDINTMLQLPMPLM